MINLSANRVACLIPVEQYARTHFPCHDLFHSQNNGRKLSHTKKRKEKRIGKLRNHSFLMEHFQVYKIGVLSACP